MSIDFSADFLNPLRVKLSRLTLQDVSNESITVGNGHVRVKSIVTVIIGLCMKGLMGV